jgi:hypothetical protein
MSDINSNFGYKKRHKIEFDFTDDRGRFILWSYYDGGFLGNGNITNTFPFHGVNNVFAILLGLNLAKIGESHGFTNGNGDFIKIYRKDDIILFQIRGESNTGELTASEVEDIELLCKDILMKKGIPFTEIKRRISF